MATTGVLRDGPEGFEWVFRNRIESRREETFYVDLVSDDDDSTRWVRPKSYDTMPIWNPSLITDVVITLGRAGLYTPEGFAITGQVWRNVTVNDALHWQDVRQCNIQIIQALGEAGMQQADLSARDLGEAVEHWTFPLFDLDLTKREVDQDELDEQLRHGEAQFYGDVYGG